MVAQAFEIRTIPYPTNFILAAISRCDDAEWAVAALQLIGLGTQDIRLFHGHRVEERVDPTKRRLGPLKHTLRYLERVLAMERSFLREYEDHGEAGHHILLVNLHRSDQANPVSAILHGHSAYTVRHYGDRRISNLLPVPASNEALPIPASEPFETRMFVAADEEAIIEEWFNDPPVWDSKEPIPMLANRPVDTGMYLGDEEGIVEPWFNDAPFPPDLVTIADLRTVDILEELSDEQLASIVGIGNYIRIPQDTVLAKQGKRLRCLYSVLEGQVQLTTASPQGEITVRVAGEGESVPLATLVGAGKLITSAYAMTDLTAMQFPCAALNRLFSERPEIGKKVYQAVAGILGGRYDQTLTRLIGTLEHGLRQTEIFAEAEG